LPVLQGESSNCRLLHTTWRRPVSPVPSLAPAHWQSVESCEETRCKHGVGRESWRENCRGLQGAHERLTCGELGDGLRRHSALPLGQLEGNSLISQRCGAVGIGGMWIAPRRKGYVMAHFQLGSEGLAAALVEREARGATRDAPGLEDRQCVADVRWASWQGGHWQQVFGREKAASPGTSSTPCHLREPCTKLAAADAVVVLWGGSAQRHGAFASCALATSAY